MSVAKTDPARTSPWPEYYRSQVGRPPRELLLDALARRGDAEPGFAIDLGCGSGIETAVLLARGWRVLAIDKHPEFEEWVRRAVPPGLEAQVETRVAAFESLELPPCDLLHASYSLPFCKPDYFGRLWDEVRAALRPDAWFVGQLFGPRDTWATTSADVMNFHDAADVQRLLQGLDVFRLAEDRHDGDSLSGPKHWHIFDVIARRPG